MAKTIDLIGTIKGSLLENFYPRGWDLKKIDRCCGLNLKQLTTPAKWWSPEFLPRVVADVAEMDRRMGDEIADQIESTRREGRKLAIILPVGPMGMYKIVVERLKASRTRCDHVTTFNMDEWADKQGNTMPGDQPGGFEHDMVQVLFSPLGRFTIPPKQRNFALKSNLRAYPQKISQLKKEGAKLVTVYGIGRVFHIAFWEPQLAGQY